MKTRIKGLLACLAAGTLVGCASGGGSRAAPAMARLHRRRPRRNRAAPAPNPIRVLAERSTASRSNASPRSVPRSMRRWLRPRAARCPMPKPSRRSACIHRPGRRAARPGLRSLRLRSRRTATYAWTCTTSPTRSARSSARSPPEQWSAAQGAPIEWPAAPLAGDPALNPFTKRPGDTSVHSAAFDFDLRYQSFGAWNDHAGGFHGYLMAWSQGQTTPGHAVPKTGSATFTGKLIGFYVAPTGAGATAGADVTVNANFSSRSLGFASSGTTVQGSAARSSTCAGRSLTRQAKRASPAQ